MKQKICPYGLCCNQMKREKKKKKLKTRISKKNGVSQLEALIPYGSLLNIENVKRERGRDTEIILGIHCFP
jgi:hypothetical protein